MSINMAVALYVELMIISMILPFCILLKLKVGKENSSHQRAFAAVLGAVILAMVCVGLAYSVNGKAGKTALIINHVANTIRPLAGGFMAYEWFWFVLFRMKCRFRRKSWLGVAVSIPAVVLAIMALASCKTGWIYRITTYTNYYLYGTIYGVLYAVYIGYFLAAFAYSVYKYVTSSHIDDNKKFSRIFVSASLFLAIALTMQLIFSRLPILAPASAVALALVYVYLTNTQVVIDSLTGVNNRSQFDKYLHSEVERKIRTQKMFLMLFDMDDFKTINDSYGHDVGDDALKLTASAIKHTYGEYGGFIARFGGDEFAAIIEAETEEVPTYLASKLIEELDSINETKKYPFELHISIGIAQFSEDDDETSFFKKADLEMYNAKKANKAARAKKNESTTRANK